jgi:hypothetical protein
MTSWKERLRDLFIAREPDIPSAVLEGQTERLRQLPADATVCIKVSCAYDLPYPFAVSSAFVGRVVSEIHAANPAVNILLTEGGVGSRIIGDMAARHGLDAIPNACFVDAENSDSIFVANPNPAPYRMNGFYLPACWVSADLRILLTTCKLRSHHFQRWYSGGTRNLIGLLPRAHYKLSASKRDMRSEMHQRGVDAMVADLYATTGQNLLTILDARLLARQDEHLPVRFTRKIGRVLVADDPAQADEQMADLLRLPFTPPYLAMIAKSRLSLQTSPL